MKSLVHVSRAGATILLSLYPLSSSISYSRLSMKDPKLKKHRISKMVLIIYLINVIIISIIDTLKL